MILKWSTECLESDCWKMLFKMKLFNFKMNWDLLFCFLFGLIDFFFVCHGGSLVVPRCRSPLYFTVVLTFGGLPRDVSPPKDWWDFLFPPPRARALNARARVSVTQFASRNLGDGIYLEGFGRQMIIKLWSYIISKLTDFLLLCILKSAFFFTAKGPPHKWWRSMVSNANLDFG